MIEGFAYFPSIVYRDEHPEWVNYFLNVTQKYFDAHSNQGTVCQTSHIGNDPAVKFFNDYLEEMGQLILSGQGYAMDRYDLYVSGLWGQEINGHGGTDIHVHKNSQLCGWLFLETATGGSYPVYYDTRITKQMVELDYTPGEQVTNATSEIHFNNIIPGTILISNSWMQHQLTPNMADRPTKAIHFIISHKEKLWNTC